MSGLFELSDDTVVMAEAVFIIPEGTSAADRRTIEIKAKKHAKSTKHKYKPKQQTFLQYLRAECVPQISVTIRGDLKKISTRMIEKFFSTRKIQFGKRRDEAAGSSALSNYRSAIVDLFLRNKVDLPSGYQQSSAEYFSGLKREEAQMRQEGKLPSAIGKSPLSFLTFVTLAHFFLVSGVDTRHVFAHYFLIVMWHLLCRASSAANIHLSHLIISQDSIGIAIPKTKADQEGERGTAKDLKHCYCNLDRPEICFFLGLGVFFLCMPFSNDPHLLFKGNDGNQKHRFYKVLDEIFLSSSLPLDLTGCRYQYGCHSCRKGAATFVASGSVGGPSIVAICLRCGWSLGGVEDRYIRYEAAGDCFVGRVVAGLDIASSRFSQIPPHFCDPTSIQKIAPYLPILFPRLYGKFQLNSILMAVLAVVVYQKEWLREKLDSSHMIFKTPLFLVTVEGHQLIDFLHQFLHSELSCPLMPPTGIPPYSIIMEELERHGKELVTIREEIDKIPSKVAVCIDSMWGVRVSRSGFSRDDLRSIIRAELDAAGFRAVMEAVQQNRQEAPASLPALLPQVLTTHGVPPTFSFNHLTIPQAWHQWFLGNVEVDVRPFRYLTPGEMPSNGVRKRLSDYRSLIRWMLARVEEVDANLVDRLKKSPPTLDDIAAGLEHALKSIPAKATSTTRAVRGGRREYSRRPEHNGIFAALKRIRKNSNGPSSCN